ncbi:MAG: DNA translocase FtsK 4TM domain-containing protein [Pseudomonadaceae bacterium]|nr:DNA translocase FtsK 4TM domain-containing protein [Pseudomonadaceae bacterium]
MAVTQQSTTDLADASAAPGFYGREIALVFLTALATFLLLALVSYSPSDNAWTVAGGDASISNWLGLAGAWSADVLLFALGQVAYALPLLMLASAALALFRTSTQTFNWLFASIRALAWLFLVLSCCLLVELHWPGESALPASHGGALGSAIVDVSIEPVGHLGLTLIAVTAFFMSLQASLNFSWLSVAEHTGRALHFSMSHLVASLRRTQVAMAAAMDRYRDRREARQLARAEQAEAARIESQEQERIAALADSQQTPALDTPVSLGPEEAVEPVLRLVEPDVPAKPKLIIEQPKKSASAAKAKQRRLLSTHAEGELPDLDLLDDDSGQTDIGYSAQELDSLARLVETKLADFNIQAEVVSVLPGPVVTRFEIQPAPGIKVQRISSLVKDLARSLAVVSVRVVEVIPGKSVVGIEIPNERREIVRLKEVLESKAYQSSKSPVTLCLGKDIAGESVVADVAKMPHLLVAGTTGSGKSVGVNAMILSILYKATPEQVRLILIDPKMLELSIYEGIPHLLTPVVTDMKDAAQSLNWCVAEMERRYRLMAALGVRNLAGFNKQVNDAIKAGTPLTDPLYSGEDPSEAPELENLPLIVVVIDEFADMMMIVGKKVEQLIARIAQKARAAGVHLVLATQRPSVDVITGLIKANIPTRISFQVSSKVDSRTILDQGGAEQLLGHGDMLFLPPGSGIPRRVHGAFVDDDEVHRVVADWRERGDPDYLPELLEVAGDDAFVQIEGTSSDSADSENDPLYDEAVAFVLESRRASISAVQRKLRIGYNRAARLVEAMEAAGLVTPMNSNGSREVAVPGREH